VNEVGKWIAVYLAVFLAVAVVALALGAGH
jgi:hypothetical protein